MKKKMPILKQKSNKLYYRKWTYKIECVVPSGWRIRNAIKHNIPFPNKILDCDFIQLASKYSKETADYVEFYKAVEPILRDKRNTQFRVESSVFNIFCNDEKIVDDLENKVSKWIKVIYEPADLFEKDFLISSGHTKILCDNFPYSKYAYKVVLKENMKSQLRKQFLDWSKKYAEKIDISRQTVQWLDDRIYWKQDPFMYVDTGATLTMVTLFLGANVKAIYEYVLRDTLVKE
jgi:hypothetical protein